MLSEIDQTEKDKYYDVIYVWNKTTTSKLIRVEIKLISAKDWGGVGGGELEEGGPKVQDR